MMPTDDELADSLAPAQHLGMFDIAHEHGGGWLTCLHCGAQWAVVSTSHGLDLEEVSVGDLSCAEEDA